MADPKTCWHNVVFADFSKDINNPKIKCSSCNKTITDKMWLKKNYEYDISHNVWVHYPDSRCKTKETK